MAKKKEETVKVENKEEIIEKEKKERFIYLGPFLLKEGVNTGTVFIGKPQNMDKLKEKYKGIERLFIPIKDIVKSKSGIKKEGSMLHTTFNSVLEEIRKPTEEVIK